MEQNVILNAKDSDPEKLKWMMGFPPEKEKIISAKDGSFFEFPALRYSVNHMREFFPTRGVSTAKTDLYKFRHDLDRKIDEITYSYKGKSYTDTLEFEIIGKNHDVLSEIDPNYNLGSPTAGLTFRAMLSATGVMNSGTKEWLGNPTLDGGGWALSDLRAWLNDGLNSESFLKDLPIILQENIKSVKKLSDNGYYDYYASIDKGSTPTFSLTETNDKIFIASAEELNAYRSTYTLEGQGTPYTMFADDASRKASNLYWTRSTGGKYGIHSFCVIDLDGRLSTNGGGNKNGIMIYFCI